MRLAARCVEVDAVERTAALLARGRRRPRGSLARRRRRVIGTCADDTATKSSTLVRDHLAEELEVDAAEIAEETRFKEDLDADSLDLYELVMELEDRYGISVSEEQAARIETVGDAVDFVARARPGVSAAGDGSRSCASRAAG